MGKKASIVEEDFIGADEAAEVSGLSIRLIQHHATEGNLPARKIGRYWLFRRADVKAFVPPKPGPKAREKQ